MSVKKNSKGGFDVVVGTHDTRAAAERQDKAAGKDKSGRASLAKGKKSASSKAKRTKATFS